MDILNGIFLLYNLNLDTKLTIVLSDHTIGTQWGCLCWSFDVFEYLNAQHPNLSKYMRRYVIVYDVMNLNLNRCCENRKKN